MDLDGLLDGILLGADETEGSADGVLVPLGFVDDDGLLLRSRLLGADETEGIADGVDVEPNGKEPEGEVVVLSGVLTKDGTAVAE